MYWDPLSETRKDARSRLEEEGRWEEFCARREECKAEVLRLTGRVDANGEPSKNRFVNKKATFYLALRDFPPLELTNEDYVEVVEVDVTQFLRMKGETDEQNSERVAKAREDHEARVEEVRKSEEARWLRVDLRKMYDEAHNTIPSRNSLLWALSMMVRDDVETWEVPDAHAYSLWLVARQAGSKEAIKLFDRYRKL